MLKRTIDLILILSCSLLTGCGLIESSFNRQFHEVTSQNGRYVAFYCYSEETPNFVEITDVTDETVSFRDIVIPVADLGNSPCLQGRQTPCHSVTYSSDTPGIIDVRVRAISDDGQKIALTGAMNHALRQCLQEWRSNAMLAINDNTSKEYYMLKPGHREAESGQELSGMYDVSGYQFAAKSSMLVATGFRFEGSKMPLDSKRGGFIEVWDLASRKQKAKIWTKGLYIIDEFTTDPSGRFLLGYTEKRSRHRAPARITLWALDVEGEVSATPLYDKEIGSAIQAITWDKNRGQFRVAYGSKNVVYIDPAE